MQKIEVNKDCCYKVNVLLLDARQRIYSEFTHKNIFCCSSDPQSEGILQFQIHVKIAATLKWGYRWCRNVTSLIFSLIKVGNIKLLRH